ncbi:MAG: ABC transporter permease [Anaerolineales bacterium]|jgi:peptide/nickel transport system permease protein|nr:ABC transporter permease [Chloroflexota bacterium]MBK6645493.1 ABC transporter permease [Anaerolineales bacterium]MCC6986625.1 ABC transporter permease [Anaerolineales bacterium]
MTVTTSPLTESANQRTARHVLSVILRDPLSLIGTIIIILVLFMAIFADQVAPYPEEGKGKTNAPNTLMAPSAEHLFGTDKLGRDILSRIIMGSRSALIVPIGVVLFAVLLGAPLGALAGYKGGWLDEVIMRITDLFLAFPSLLLAMAIASALGRGLDKAAIALVVSWWPWYTRIARGVAVGLRERYFVEAAQAIGVSDAVIIFRHILPNTISPILVQATVDMGTVILAMGGLAFLGLGTQPPAPDWGLMVSEGRTYILDQWWIATFPGMAIFIVVLAFNLLGDTLRDIFDPRQYR